MTTFAQSAAANIVWMVTHLANYGEIAISQRLLDQLSQISVSTARRILKRIRQDEPGLPRTGPSQASRVARDIPMKWIYWNEQQPGHFGVDLVHHCGPNASGEYVHTIQMIDVATGWSERVAVLGHSYLVMEDAFRRILAHLPFPVLEIHPNNGSEFLNAHRVRFWKETVKGVAFSRSRPFYKNDNRFAEQKNSTLVQAYLGFARFDSIPQTKAINQLYDKMWLYYNFSQPVMRVREKIIVSREGQCPRIKRRLDQARTPFERLCETDMISKERKEQLQTLCAQVNPRQLRQEICQLMIISFVCLVPFQGRQKMFTKRYLHLFRARKERVSW